MARLLRLGTGYLEVLDTMDETGRSWHVERLESGPWEVTDGAGLRVGPLCGTLRDAKDAIDARMGWTS